jgi:hypothetical protein
MPEKKKNPIVRIKRNPWKSAICIIIIVFIVFWWKPRKSAPTEVQNFLENRDIVV